MAECIAGANKNAMPTCFRHSAIWGGGKLMLTERASITSAEPHLEVTLRFPCLATRTPAPAATRAVAVEMLKVPLASPPVPQVSTRASRSVPLRSIIELAVISRGVAAARIADRVLNEYIVTSKSQAPARNGVVQEGPIEYRWLISSTPWNQDTMRQVVQLQPAAHLLPALAIR